MAATRAAGVGGAWAARLPVAEAACAGGLRLLPGIEVCEAGPDVWLRGPRRDEALDALLRKLPGARRYDVGPGGECTLEGRRLPAAQLPERGWERLSTWLAPKLGRVAAPAQPASLAKLTVVRGGPEQPGRVLRADLESWGRWAATAPAIRLAPLRFAADEDGSVLVWGHPLPPICGRRYSERDALAVPCGFQLWPALDSALVRSALRLAPGDLAVFEEDGPCEVAPVEALVPATRTAVRRTVARGRRP